MIRAAGRIGILGRLALCAVVVVSCLRAAFHENHVGHGRAPRAGAAGDSCCVHAAPDTSQDAPPAHHHHHAIPCPICDFIAAASAGVTPPPPVLTAFAAVPVVQLRPSAAPAPRGTDRPQPRSSRAPPRSPLA